MKIKRPLFSSTHLLAWDCERPNGRFYVQSRAHAWHKTGIECSQASAPRRWPFKIEAAETKSGGCPQGTHTKQAVPKTLLQTV